MERMRLSREIIETCLEMTSLGLNQGTAGNVSARYENGMLITPSGIPYERLTENMIVYVVFTWRHTRRVRMPMRLSITMPYTARPFQFLIALSRQFTT